MTDEERAPADQAGAEELPDIFIATGGQRIRVRYRPGVGVPLVVCNGIGASLEVLDPFVDALDPQRPVIRFDAPGTGESPASLLPYGFPYLAWVLGRVLDDLGVGVVDVLGLSWGGALAQQFAFQNPWRCRRLILVSTGTGAVMIPGNPLVLRKMLTPRRFKDPTYGAQIAGELYGGTVREDGQDVAEIFIKQLHAGSKVGYVHQLLAGAVWTSLFALPAIRQKTLIMAGEDDPIIPMANAKIMKKLMPRATLFTHPGGHVDLVTNAAKLVPVIDEFLGAPHIGKRTWRGRPAEPLTPGG
ncbi:MULTISPECIES: alpha/beta fold hydrolase [Tsukamurella]|uniref:Alpha/beta fold hydrolase n=1 Tax=Tsukamurella strandjordii TaxID=147577 RepID=A0AA90NJH4_9ACTN|nr:MULTISPECIES: alpha/beta fold hydrolase [Tsukamurella]MDP0399885.1 alpha/beta fold hydrolase [Tsukamurella strandjordii]GIZ97488.1 poly(3-hydroxyalkanoic acid) depolymerase [Tsukamurella sp. TY48]